MKLTREEIMAIQVMSKKSMTNRELARQFNVDESTVRYHLTREGKTDGRSNKPQKADEASEAITYWLEENHCKEDGRPPNAKLLWEHLVDNLNYQGSYKSILRYLRRHLPQPKMRPLRRIETPLGIQAQADWGEFKINIGGYLEKLYAFVLTLSFSRAFAVVWSRRMDMSSWLNCHNQAFKALGGIPYVIRIDNLKTGVIKGAGAKAQIHPVYASYAKELRFVVEPCRAYKASDKGKVEAKVKLLRYGINPQRQEFAHLEELQTLTNNQTLRRFKSLKNPLSGSSVYEALQEEKRALKPLPHSLPVPFDTVLSRKVSNECLVSFEGKLFSVPFEFMKRRLEVRGASSNVLIFGDGRLIAEHNRESKKRVVIDQSHYEGEETGRVLRPTPLGRLAKAQLDLWDIPIEKRPLDLYEQLLAVKKR